MRKDREKNFGTCCLPEFICNFVGHNLCITLNCWINMAKRRLLKKSLQLVMGDLFTATVVASLKENADTEKVHGVQGKIIEVYSDFNTRLSHYDRKNAKAYFRQYREEVSKAVDGIVDEINGIC